VPSATAQPPPSEVAVLDQRRKIGDFDPLPQIPNRSIRKSPSMPSPKSLPNNGEICLRETFLRRAWTLTGSEAVALEAAASCPNVPFPQPQDQKNQTALLLRHEHLNAATPSHRRTSQSGSSTTLLRPAVASCFSRNGSARWPAQKSPTPTTARSL